MTPGHPTSSPAFPPAPASGPLAWGAWPRVRPVSAARVWVWGVLYCLILVPAVGYVPRMSGNVASRYATIESIVERGTLAVERSSVLRQTSSVDVVRFGGHSYSDKPPVLPALASPIYFALWAAGARFTASYHQFMLCNFALAWPTATFASGLCLVAFRAMLQGVAISRRAADLATVALGFGSPLLTYAVTFNNHSVAAGCVSVAWALAVLERPGRGAGYSRIGGGLLAALAATIDLPVGCLTVAALGLVMLIRGGRAVATFAAGAAGPLLLHCGLQSLVTGTPLPVEMYPEAFEYPGSYWLTPEGNWQDPRPRWLFGVDFLVGRQGAFTVFPVLWFGLIGLIGSAFRRRADGSVERPAAVLVGGTFLTLVVYYIWGVRRTDYAGSSYGARHLLAITPMIGLFAVVALARLRPRWLWVTLAALVTLIGGAYATIGATEPWNRVEIRARTNPTLQWLQRGVLYPYGTFRGEHPPAEGKR